MFDRDTLIISYAAERGEPRGKHKQGESWEGKGHCIDCSSCVVVCPMGIDIRNGLQFDCIGCGLCIDACNDVMEKIGLPRGLVHYDTENNQQKREAANSAGQKSWRGKMLWIRPRTVFYAAILSVVGSLMLGAILLRSATELDVIHNRSPLFVRLSSGDIRNNYQLKVLNKSHFDQTYEISVEGMTPTATEVRAAGDVLVPSLVVPANSVGDFRVQITSAQEAAGRRVMTFVLRDVKTRKETKHDSYFIQP